VLRPKEAQPFFLLSLSDLSAAAAPYFDKLVSNMHHFLFAEYIPRANPNNLHLASFGNLAAGAVADANSGINWLVTCKFHATCASKVSQVRHFP
jgi:hypothetical protein